MRVAELTIHVVHLPLKRVIKHASATRSESANLLVRCRLSDGTSGWGEGVPRSYVTGETVDGALAQFAATPVEEQLNVDCQTWSDVIRLCERFEPAAVVDNPRGCYGNALRCAVELSLLDAFGRLFGEPVSGLVKFFEPAATIRTSLDSVRYSGAITAETPSDERLSAIKMRVYGFAQCKVKVGVAGADDRRRLTTIRRWLGRRMDVRIDANEAWRPEEYAARLEPLLKHRLSCIEQPLPHADLPALAELRGQVPVPVMLDESLTSEHDARAAIRLGACDLFNLRLSKCGGFLNSLRLAALAREHGLGLQLGCHPGESGVLSAAGRHWACSVNGIRYLEGSYDRHLLRELPTHEDVTFGYGGRARALRGPGLGVTINERVFLRLVTKQETRFV